MENPKNDLTFKKVFGQHPHLLKSLLYALLHLEPDAQIAEHEYLPSELVPEVPEVCKNIVDVRCVDQKKTPNSSSRCRCSGPRPTAPQSAASIFGGSPLWSCIQRAAEFPPSLTKLQKTAKDKITSWLVWDLRQRVQNSLISNTLILIL